ncbi:OmpA family protein [Magnetovibrio sp. PR-2]|uniref:OmpA family protein n=1 Tax=Magnetovibrio sp. PR-2 TaxID=3120356 RepID=UPI002FCE34E0
MRNFYTGITAALVLGVLAFGQAVPVLASDEMEPQARVKSFNDIVRSLAPIAGQTEANGSVDLEIPFALNSAELLPGALAQLEALAAALETGELAAHRFQIIGHTDASGAAEYNRQLSAKRADAVKAFLTGEHKIAEDRLSTKGMGEDQLKNALSPEAADNRRVEVILIPLTGEDVDKTPLPSDGVEVRSDGTVKVQW